MESDYSSTRPGQTPMHFATRNVVIATPLLLTTLAALPVTSARADSIATDRPDFVESSAVVGRGRLQIEMGSPYETDEEDGVEVSTSSMPTLLRYGIGYNTELRLETDNYIRQETRTAAGTVKETGYADIALGFKHHFLDNDGLAPSMAMLGHVDVDSGSVAFRGEGLRPSLHVVAEWELSPSTSFGIKPGVIRDKADGERYWGGILGVTMGHQWTNKLRSFVEVAGQQLASKEHGGDLITYDAGFTYLVTDSLQFDTSVNVGATDETPDLNWGMGVSMRF